MRVATTLALFAAGLVVTFLLSFGVGRAVGPLDQPERDHPPATATTTTMDPGMDMGGHP